ncbi:hypothetical protein, partial [Citrobacter cronae]|uniref:hypothetical protein n=1 Tax=Citrobacter cronae TaxID=1748967 RepID=UPI001F463592
KKFKVQLCHADNHDENMDKGGKWHVVGLSNADENEVNNRAATTIIGVMLVCWFRNMDAHRNRTTDGEYCPTDSPRAQCRKCGA